MGLWAHLGPLPAHHGSPGQMTRGLSRWPLILTVCSQPFSFVPIDLRRLVAEARRGDDVDEVVRSFIQHYGDAHRLHGAATLLARNPFRRFPPST